MIIVIINKRLFSKTDERVIANRMFVERCALLYIFISYSSDDCWLIHDDIYSGSIGFQESYFERNTTDGDLAEVRGTTVVRPC